MPSQTHLEEVLTRNDVDIPLSSRDRGWHDLGAIRTRTPSGTLRVAPQPDHLLTVQVGLEPTQTEAYLGSSMYRSIHTRGAMNLIPAGTESRWQFNLPTDDIVLVLSPLLVARVAAENDGDGVELVPSSGTHDPQMERFALLLNGELESGCANGRLFSESLATALTLHLLSRHAAHPIAPPTLPRGPVPRRPAPGPRPHR